jgi:endo-1,4-beta-mannosidase
MLYEKTEPVLAEKADIAVVRTQIRNLCMRVENKIVPAISREHHDANIRGEIISRRYTDQEIEFLLLSTLAKQVGVDLPKIEA